MNYPKNLALFFTLFAYVNRCWIDVDDTLIANFFEYLRVTCDPCVLELFGEVNDGGVVITARGLGDYINYYNSYEKLNQAYIEEPDITNRLFDVALDFYTWYTDFLNTPTFRIPQ